MRTNNKIHMIEIILSVIHAENTAAGASYSQLPLTFIITK